MNPRLSAKLLIAASIFYGLVVAFLSFIGSPGMTGFAVAGALVIGGLWAVRGIFLNRQ